MKNHSISLFSLLALSAVALSSCSDSFLQEKKNYDNVNVDIYNYYEGCNSRVSDIYSWCLPDVGSNANWKYNCTGNADDQSKSTEEFSGFSVFVHPDNELTVMSGNNVPDYFHNQSNNIQASVWGRIRNINDAILGIEGGSLPQEQKDMFLGQVYFFRAWCYYQLVKWYGGVPIMTTVEEPIEGTQYPRNSARECIEFILSDLEKSATMLEASTAHGGWRSSEDWGRITTGTALALKGRVLLLWASPLFNRTGDESRWTTAYSQMSADLAKIQQCGYGLYDQTSGPNAASFAALFAQTSSPEAVFQTCYNTIQSGDTQKNSNWERSIRPKNASGSGLNPSAMIVDMFPMADGRRPASCATYTKLPASDYVYNPNYPFLDRDPRFYRTFAFPGVRWAYNGDATLADPNNPLYNKGADYELWNYVWYNNADDRDNIESSNTYGAENLLANVKGMYVRKRSDDADVNGSPLYSWAASTTVSGFTYSAAPYIEIRYAEVLLNLAEAAAGAGQMGEAVELLRQIRRRVGYTGDCGLDASLTGDKAACLSAVLYERQIELAYEGKRFDDLRRWLLFDGGANFAEVKGAPSTWTLSGWGGNTCAYLGFTPLNGQRRENLEFRVSEETVKQGLGGTTINDDPLVFELNDQEISRPAAIDLRYDITEQCKALKDFYAEFLVRKTKKGDGYTSDHMEQYIHFFAKYYFLGLPQAAMASDQGLQQTIGWEDYNQAGANGTFDPLAN
ncbi:MAG: RagB/SusD family nutrient uptake outer membrane protein [Bacteroidales bacterium]|nr:RagB/SusD family nutrient uptake outer membrane protein [Bacteroidales bacterium]